jgi:uncharacterized protein
MSRPKNIPVIDLMMEIPTDNTWMVAQLAQALSRERGMDDFSHHPAQYLFKDTPERMNQKWDLERIITMMDEYGVAMAQVGVDPVSPEGALALFDKLPTRFFGEVFVDPNAGMDSVRALEQTVKSHPNFKAAFAAPCLLNPQVPIDDRKFYPIYAKCCELDIPINMLVGVPGPRLPYKCQHPGLLDEVAWFFPDLKVVMRHGGDPWTDLCVKLLLKWPNLYYSTSAWAPKHYPRNILEFANKRGRDKVLYAGYFPGLSYERIFNEMDDLPLKEETWAPFLRENAIRVYKLDDILAK